MSRDPRGGDGMCRRWSLVLAMALVVACGQAPARPADLAPDADLAAPIADRLFVARADGLTVIDVASGQVIRELPAGISSADRSTHYVVEPGQGETIVRMVEAETGTRLKELVVSGRFDLPTGYGP